MMGQRKDCSTAGPDGTTASPSRAAQSTTGGNVSSGAGNPLAFSFTAESMRCAVNDVAWSPVIATRFVSVSDDGNLRLWEVGRAEPLVTHNVGDDRIGAATDMLAKLTGVPVRGRDGRLVKAGDTCRRC